MKKISIFSITLLLSFGCFAQAEFGIFGGLHATSAIYTIKNVKQPTDFKYGFHMGVGYKIPFENRLYFAPAISYKLMGYKVVFNRPSFPPDLLAKDNNTSFHEVDVDPLLQYNLCKKPDHLFLRAGPSFNFILWGKEKFNLVTGEHVSRSMKFSTTDNYGRFEASIVVQLGFETSAGFTVYAHYVQHLISMNNEEEGPFIQNYLVGLTFGKFFKPRK